MNQGSINSYGPFNVLGVDIGSVSAGMVILGPGKQVVEDIYEFHHGNVSETVEKMLEQIDLSTVGAVAVTDQTPRLIKADYRCDEQIAVIEAAGHFNSKIGSVLHVGGEKFSVLFFDHKGELSGLKTNTSCAAGTGSFLDQQAVRLNLSGIAHLAEIAAENSSRLPQIASRCAVFAKTDLTHAQQEGYSLSEICDGLCHGLAVNIANTVFSNKKPNIPIVICGGVARNSAVVEHIGSIVGSELVVNEMAHLYGAFGAAARMLEEQGPPVHGLTSSQDILNRTEFARQYGHPPLELVKSRYPDFGRNNGPCPGRS